MLRRLLVLLMLGLAGQGMAADADVALVTAITGTVSQLGGTAPRLLEPFARLRQGDVLLLGKDSGTRLIFFGSRREESWRGEGRIDIGAEQGNGTGLAEPQVRMLPEGMARQIAKTPSAALQKAPAGKLRSIDMEGSLGKLDSDYRRLRKEAAADDINPEIFLLAGLFELREFVRLEQTLKELRASQPERLEVAVLGSLYKKAISQTQQR